MIFFENFYRFKKKLFNKTELQISNDINFGSKKANEYFIKKLKKSKFYFEFGSGSSTLLADSLKKKFVSIELDKSFFNLMKKKLKNKDIYYINIGPVGEFSYPLFRNKKKIIKYITLINKFFLKKKFPNLILIDGRFRVACCINLYFLLKKYKKNPIIILDDFEKRKHYQVLKKIFYINKIGRMGILKIKKKLKNKPLKITDYIFDSR
jgi:hypothetical protein